MSDRTTTSGPSGATEGSLFLGDSAGAAEVRRLIARAAKVDSTVLITGESGTGKELVAREIHRLSQRSDSPFIPVNCAAIPPALVESELFGHERGAFTDARERRRGVFELAGDGTLFLDEIGDLGLEAQPKLLRVLETAEIMRVGGEHLEAVACRIITATNQSLKAMCDEKRFRSDLYYRLRVFTIHLPPLRERRDDVPMLAEHFAQDVASRFGREYTRISSDALELLSSYAWPGNVRELKSMVERAMVMHSGYLLDRESFDLHQVTNPGGLGGLLEKDWKQARSEFEAAYAKRLLDKHGGNVQDAARDAGLAPGSLYKMLRRLGLRPGSKSS